MKISSVRIYRYGLPLTEPLRLKDKTLTTRSGLLVRVQDENGASGCGDVAPLPGFSIENLSDAAADAMRAARVLVGCDVPAHVNARATYFKERLLGEELSASVLNGFQAAIMQTAAFGACRYLADQLDEEPLEEVAVNGLLMGGAESALEQARALVDAGYRALKLKVGRQALPEDIRLVRALRGAVGDAIAIRLDANRAWDVESATTFAEGVSDCRVEYLEEPLQDPSRMVELSARTGVPVALDETLAQAGAQHLEQWRGVKAVILKPTLLGGFEVATRLARRAMNVGMTPIVSAAFESGVGIAALAHLAASLRVEAAAGLDTYRWLAEDVLAESIDMHGGCLSLAQVSHAERDICYDDLEEVGHV